jgi:hypothetical protein
MCLCEGLLQVLEADSSANSEAAAQAGKFCTDPHRAIEVTGGCWSGQHCTGLHLDWTDCSQHPQHCTDWPKMVIQKIHLRFNQHFPCGYAVYTHTKWQRNDILTMYYSGCKVIQKLHIIVLDNNRAWLRVVGKVFVCTWLGLGWGSHWK